MHKLIFGCKFTRFFAVTKNYENYEICEKYERINEPLADEDRVQVGIKKSGKSAQTEQIFRFFALMLCCCKDYNNSNNKSINQLHPYQ